MATTVGALPAAVDLVVYQGDDFWVNVRVLSSSGAPVDLSAFEPRAQVRVTPAAAEVLADFTITSPDPATLKLYLPGSASAVLPPKTAWDAQLTDADGIVMTLVAGVLRTAPEVTR